MKHRKWTKEVCQAEALRYTTRTAFACKPVGNGAYQKAVRAGWLDDICGHMIPDQYKGKQVEKWTKGAVLAEALKHTTPGQFRKAAPGAASAAHRNDWKAEAQAHMNYRTNGYWTKARVLAEAKKYDSRDVFRFACPGAYKRAWTDGYFDEACVHMERLAAGFNPSLPGMLYYFEINGLYKLGITNRTLRRRFGAQMDDARILKRWRFKNGADAAKAERAVHNYVDDCHRYKGPPVLLYGGDTELFTSDILSLDN